MASKNLGAVIQRAISDGAFRRQLQSDPAAALRGFNLTPDEVAAIRSGDSGKLMSLGVDQRMSKAFSVFGGTGASARSTLADGTASAGSSAVIDGGPAGVREGIPGDPTSGTRAASFDGAGPGPPREAFSPGDTASTSDAHSIGSVSGTRALHEEAPSDSGMMLNDPTAAQTRAINNTEPGIGNQDAVASTGDLATRQVNDNAPWDRVRASARDRELATRQVHDTAPSVASQMADANLADGTRALHNVEPTDLGSNQVAADNFLGSEIQPDPGTTSGHGFIPSDSADVQREMLDGTGNALGNTGDQHNLS